MWVHPAYHRQVFPTVTSVLDRSVMYKNFAYQGTADNTTFYTVSRAIQFYKYIGDYVSRLLLLRQNFDYHH